MLMKPHADTSCPPLPSVYSHFTQLLLVLIRVYQRYISPSLPPHCRFYPTCSQYTLQAVMWHGSWRGGWLAVRRITRCHPWGGSGIDWVPRPLYRYRFYVVEAVVINPCLAKQHFGN